MFKVTGILAFAAVALAIENFQFRAVDDKYYISVVPLEFAQAYATCKRYGWDLATEKSNEDTVQINAAITKVGDTGSYHYLGGYRQIGGEFTPAWMWLEDGRDFSYTRWYNNNEPNTTGYNCLVKQPLTVDYVGNWTAGTCNSLRLFICETI